MSKLLLFLAFWIALYGDYSMLEIPPVPWSTKPIPCPIETTSCEEEIHVDLLNPSYHHGILETFDGGVLTKCGLRIQAQHIRYIKHTDHKPPSHRVCCEGNVMIHYKKWILIGESLEFDILQKQGTLRAARTVSPPWSLGGSKIIIDSVGDLTIYDAYITTSEGKNEKDILLIAPVVTVTQYQIITLYHVNFRVKNIPIAWLPRIRIDLKKIETSPFSLRFGWGGFLGTYASLRYQFLSYNEFKGFARIDTFLGRGLGGGIETTCHSKDRRGSLLTKSYYAHDLSIDDPHKRDRYRFQGLYSQDNDLYGRTSTHLMYDIVSDPQMAAEYQTKDFALNTAGKTQLQIHTENPSFLANLFARVKVNSFQNVNQQLPAIDILMHPMNLFASKMTLENRTTLSFLDFTFSDPDHRFSSGRLSLHPQLSYPQNIGPLSIYSKIGGNGIFYTSSPSGASITQASMHADILLHTIFSKTYSDKKHQVEPFIRYHFISTPLSPIDQHYLFTIQDAFSRFHAVQFGIKNVLCCSSPPFFPVSLDLFSYAFFQRPPSQSLIPKAYSTLQINPSQRIAYEFDFGWNWEVGQCNFLRTRLLWTGNENVAASLEYRHRSRFDWRKAAEDDFLLETVRPQATLLNSPLSDRCDTLLAKVFLRFHPNWSIRWIYRHGWGRDLQRHFAEYSLNLSTVLLQRWCCDLNYESRESDKRYSITIKLNNASPPHKPTSPLINSQIFKRIVKKSRN